MPTGYTEALKKQQDEENKFKNEILSMSTNDLFELFYGNLLHNYKNLSKEDLYRFSADFTFLNKLCESEASRK